MLQLLITDTWQKVITEKISLGDDKETYNRGNFDMQQR